MTATRDLETVRLEPDFILIQGSGAYPLCMRFSPNTAGATVANSNNKVVNTGKWQHIAMVKSGINVNFYADGANAGGGATSAAHAMLFVGLFMLVLELKLTDGEKMDLVAFLRCL